jgi:hypothetical protein
MGIETGGGDILYLNVSCGRLKNKAKNIDAKGYTGYVTNITRKDDEYEGKVITKIVVSMRDTASDQLAKIAFTEESYFSIGFFSQIEGVDFSKPMLFGVSQSQENDKVSFCWLSQNNKNVERKKDFPKPEKKKVGRNVVMDWTAVTDKIDGLIGNINEKLSNVKAPAPAPSSTPAIDNSQDELFSDATNDLPF